MTDDEEVLAAADRNMVGAWKAILAGSPQPGYEVHGGLVLQSSGMPAALFNPATACGPVEPEAAVEQMVSHYAELGVPFSVRFRDAVAPGLAEACLAAGLVEHWTSALMILDPIPVAPEPPPGLEVRPIDRDSVGAYGNVLADGFGMPRSFATMLITEGMLDQEAFTGLLGLLDGEPVAASGVFLSDGFAGVYNVATVPEHRGKGLGAALTWAAARAGADAGCTASVLQASQMGEPVYARMGYATPARYRQMEPAP